MCKTVELVDVALGSNRQSELKILVCSILAHSRSVSSLNEINIELCFAVFVEAMLRQLSCEDVVWHLGVTIRLIARGLVTQLLGRHAVGINHDRINFDRFASCVSLWYLTQIHALVGTWAYSIIPSGNILRLGVIKLLFVVVIAAHFGLRALAQANVVLVFAVRSRWYSLTFISLLQFLRFGTIHERRDLSSFVDHFHARFNLSDSRAIWDHWCWIDDLATSHLLNRSLLNLAREDIGKEVTSVLWGAHCSCVRYHGLRLHLIRSHFHAFPWPLCCLVIIGSRGACGYRQVANFVFVHWMVICIVHPVVVSLPIWAYLRLCVVEAPLFLLWHHGRLMALVFHPAIVHTVIENAAALRIHFISVRCFMSISDLRLRSVHHVIRLKIFRIQSVIIIFNLQTSTVKIVFFIFRVPFSIYIVSQLDEFFMISSHLAWGLKSRVVALSLRGEHARDGLLPHVARMSTSWQRLIEAVHSRYWIPHYLWVSFLSAVNGAEHMGPPHMLLLLNLGLIFTDLHFCGQAGFASALWLNISRLRKEIVTCMIWSVVLLSHQYLVLAFWVKGRIQECDLAVEVVISQPLIICRLSHV